MSKQKQESRRYTVQLKLTDAQVKQLKHVATDASKPIGTIITEFVLSLIGASTNDHAKAHDDARDA